MKKVLLLGALMGTTMLGATPAMAQDAAQTQAQIDALRSQLDALQGQLSALQSQQAQTQAQAQQAIAQSKAPAVLPKALEWAADTKVSGRMYFDVHTVSADNAAGNNVEKDGGFEIKRFYLGVDHKFNDVFSGNITTDISQVAGVGQTLYIKKAYLQAKINPALVVRLGATDMPWIPYVEGIYGYRHIEKTLTDLDGFGTSSDWGVHLSGDLAHGVVSYQVSAVNGGGYRNPNISTKSIDLEGRLSVAYKGFNAAVGGYTGKLGADVTGATLYHTANRFNALLAYKGKVNDIGFTVGGEYFYAKNWKNVATVAEDSSDGYSLFASVSPAKKWSVFGRYDWVKPSKKLAPLQKDQYFNVGVQYSPAKIVDLALVYKRDDGDNGIKIGNLGTGQATRDEFGLYGQFRF